MLLFGYFSWPSSDTDECVQGRNSPLLCKHAICNKNFIRHILRLCFWHFVSKNCILVVKFVNTKIGASRRAIQIETYRGPLIFTKIPTQTFTDTLLIHVKMSHKPRQFYFIVFERFTLLPVK